MATIVVHKTTKKRYVLIGSGFGVWSRTASLFAKGSAEGEARALAGVDETGEVTWFHAHDMLIESIDGKPPQYLLESTGPFR